MCQARDIRRSPHQFTVHVRHTEIRFAPGEANPLPAFVSIQSPAAIDVFCNVPLHVVTPSNPVVADAFEHATPPDDAVARAPDNRSDADPARLTRTMTLGVPAFPETVISVKYPPLKGSRAAARTRDQATKSS